MWEQGVAYKVHNKRDVGRQEEMKGVIKEARIG
jgi:hypothetical protein